VIPVLVFAALAVMIWAAPKGKVKLAFVASGLYLAGMLVGAAFALYPVVLPASTGPEYNLTIYNTAAAHHGFPLRLRWWVLGAALALAFFFFIYRMFAGKVSLEGQEH